MVIIVQILSSARQGQQIVHQGQHTSDAIAQLAEATQLLAKGLQVGQNNGGSVGVLPEQDPTLDESKQDFQDDSIRNMVEPDIDATTPLN